jgi:hypothetical protein
MHKKVSSLRKELNEIYSNILYSSRYRKREKLVYDTKKFAEHFESLKQELDQKEIKQIEGLINTVNYEIQRKYKKIHLNIA